MGLAIAQPVRSDWFFELKYGTDLLPFPRHAGSVFRQLRNFWTAAAVADCAK
jgi:hypothetical protein